MNPHPHSTVVPTAAPTSIDLVIFGIDLADAWPVLVAAVPVGALLIGAVNAWLSARNERRRTQPIVICHEQQSRSFGERSDAWTVLAYLTNEGEGSAFNVSFGTRLRGEPFPWRSSRLDGAASRIRVVRAGERYPSGESPARVGSSAYPALAVAIYLASGPLWGLAHRHAKEKARGRHSSESIDDGRVYWCRYENAQGHTWETINPHDQTADLRIHRVRFRALRERLDGRRERRLRKLGLEFEQEARAELLQAMEDADDEQ